MKDSRSGTPIFLFRVLLVPVLVFLCLAPAGGQCAFVTSESGSGTQGGMVYHYLTGPITNPSVTMCTVTMFNDVFACFPGGILPVIGQMETASPVYLAVSRFESTMMGLPSCGFNCAGNCSIVINGNTHNLPVELMDFDVEDKTGSEDSAGDSEAIASDSE